MTADRPYRPGMSDEQAMAVMRTASGDHLAAEVIDALVDVDAMAA